MKTVILLHNPGAGDKNHLQMDLVRTIEDEGYNGIYFSVKKGDNWKEQLDQTDFVAVAGGDGTVRKVMKELLQRSLLEKKLPLAILPMGTANNLAKTLGIDPQLSHEHHIKNWKNSKRQRFDLGVIKSLHHTNFFLESMGFGVFARLIWHMDNRDTSSLTSADEELQFALRALRKLTLSADTTPYRIQADNQIFEGRCILLEVMNIRSVGPNLVLAADAKTDDYISRLAAGKEASFTWHRFQAKNLLIDCPSAYTHVDDELILPLQAPVSVESREDIVDFLVSGDSL
jgi:diacylglycerol kinase (ATP)